LANEDKHKRVNYLHTKYYFLTGSSGCPSAEYMYMSKKVTGGVVPEARESSANEYPRGWWLKN